MKKLILPITIIVLGSVFMSCSKVEEEKHEIVKQELTVGDENYNGNENTDYSDARDIVSAVNFDEEIENIHATILAHRTTEQLFTTAFWDDCANISVDSAGGQLFYTLNFGTSNCEGFDRRKRNGIIEITMNKNPFVIDAIYTVVMKNYSINNIKMNGEKSIIYKGLDNDNQHIFEINSGITFTNMKGYNLTLNSQKERVWTRDKNHKLKPVTTNGTAQGNTFSLASYSIDIQETIVMDADCSNIISGKFELSGDYATPYMVDYGASTCDNEVSLIADNRTEILHLK